MSDATSLLLRLEMERGPKGIDLKDRWREVADIYEKHQTGLVGDSFFFDLHVLIGLLFGENNNKAIEEVEKAMEDGAKDIRSWNSRVYQDIAPNVIQGIKEFAQGNYVQSVDALAPVRHKMCRALSGSLAQLQIFELIMLRAAIRAGPERRQLAEQLLEEHVANCYQGKKSNVAARLEQQLLAQM